MAQFLGSRLAVGTAVAGGGDESADGAGGFGRQPALGGMVRGGEREGGMDESGGDGGRHGR